MALAIAGLVLAGVGMAVQIEQGQEAASDRKKQMAYEKRIADVKNLRSQREAIRAARVARAQVVNAGANSGTSGSSGVMGGASSVESQLGGNLSYFGEIGGLQDNVFDSQLSAAGHEGNAAMGGALGQLGGSVFSAGGGWTTVMGGNKKDTGSFAVAGQRDA